MSLQTVRGINNIQTSLILKPYHEREFDEGLLLFLSLLIRKHWRYQLGFGCILSIQSG